VLDLLVTSSAGDGSGKQATTSIVSKLLSSKDVSGKARWMHFGDILEVFYIENASCLCNTGIVRLLEYLHWHS
jgi:hypothetical protein